jgi:hypothetical protein
MEPEHFPRMLVNFYQATQNIPEVLYSSVLLPEIFTGASLNDLRPNIKHDYLVHFLESNPQHINHLLGQSVDIVEKMYPMLSVHYLLVTHISKQ